MQRWHVDTPASIAEPPQGIGQRTGERPQLLPGARVLPPDQLDDRRSQSQPDEDVQRAEEHVFWSLCQEQIRQLAMNNEHFGLF